MPLIVQVPLVDCRYIQCCLLLAAELLHLTFFCSVQLAFAECCGFMGLLLRSAACWRLPAPPQQGT